MSDNATNSVTGITPDNVVDDVAGSNDAHEAPTFVQLTVRSVERDTDKSVVVTFETSTLDRPELLAFRHGQHLTLRREFDGVEFRRSYSLCSAAPDGPLRVAVRQIPGGVFSTWANTELQAGDRLDVMTPAGHFTHELMPTEARRYTMLAAGSGITPVFSIMSTILRHEPEALVRLVYVNQTSRSTMLLEELERLRDRYLGRIQIWYAFTREETDATLLSGRPDRDRLDALIRARIRRPMLTTRSSVVRSSSCRSHKTRSSTQVWPASVYTASSSPRDRSGRRSVWHRRRSTSVRLLLRWGEPRCMGGTRRSRCSRATACSTRCSGCDPMHRSRVEVACARPARRCCSTARSRWQSTTASPTTRSNGATCSRASRPRSPIR